MISGIDTSRLHHAYGVVRDEESVSQLVDLVRKEIGISLTGNPDFVHVQVETLAIDDSRRIKEVASTRRFSAETPRVFLVELFGATREAQNALLKLLEEPEEGNHFFFVVPSLDIFLPTLRSRLALVNAPSGKNTDEAKSIAKAFLKNSLKEKITFVDALAADISDEKVPRHAALDFLNSLEAAVHEEYSVEKLRENAAVFETITRARSYMGDRAPSVKMLLEYIALSL